MRILISFGYLRIFQGFRITYIVSQTTFNLTFLIVEQQQIEIEETKVETQEETGSTKVTEPEDLKVTEEDTVPK